MAISSKKYSEKSQEQIFQSAMNDNDNSIAISGYATSKVGAKVTVTNVVASPAVDDVRYLDIVSTKTGTLTSTSPTIKNLVNVIEDLTVGQYVFVAGVPTNSTIISIDSDTQVTISANATATGSVSIKFANLLLRLRLSYDDSSRTNLVDSERLD